MDRCLLIMKKDSRFTVCFDNLRSLEDNGNKGPQIYSRLHCITNINNKDNMYVGLVYIMDFDGNSHSIYNTADFTQAEDWKYLVA